MRSIKVIDVTIRDAPQSLWGTRITNRMIMPIAGRMDDVGFYAIDIAGGAVFDVCVRFLREDPWRRMAGIRKLVRRTPLNVWLRGQSLFTFELFPDDVVEATIRQIREKGIDRLTTFDPLNDLRNVELSARVAKEAGFTLTLALAYTLSPIHTDDYYAEKAIRLIELGADEIVLKDATGLLTPERTKTLIPALVRAIAGRVPLQLHSHCRSGLAPQCYLAAIRHGVEIVHSASQPLANGASLPATEFVHRNASRLGYASSLDEAALSDMASYFTKLAAVHGKPLGAPEEYDPALYEHQVPGGMISNLLLQLKEAGIEDKLGAILEEMARVRKDLGYPVVVSPFAQFLVTQATLNVVQGERYRTIPDEIRKYALGYYGRPAGPLDGNFLDRAASGGQSSTGRPGDHLEPGLDAARKAHPDADPDDLLLHIFYEDAVLQPLFEARDQQDQQPESGNALLHLLKEIGKRPHVSLLELANADGESLAIRRDLRLAKA